MFLPIKIDPGTGSQCNVCLDSAWWKDLFPSHATRYQVRCPDFSAVFHGPALEPEMLCRRLSQPAWADFALSLPDARELKHKLISACQ